MPNDAADSNVPTCGRHGRRVFLCRLGLAATASALAGCEFSEIYDTGAQAGATLDFDVSQAAYEALATVGGKQVVTVGGAKVLLIRAADDQVVAFGTTCPHQGQSLQNAKWDTATNTLRCLYHSAKFNADGGVASWPESGAGRPATTYAVEFANPIGKVTT